jgi:hypothetical protein
LPEAESSLEYLRSVYRSASQPRDVRLRAAIAAAPFEHPKLSVSGHANLGLGLANAIEQNWLARKRKTIDVTPAKADFNTE